MEISVIEQILPVYHRTQKCRHDLLCKELARTEELRCFWEDEISEAINYIEDLIGKSVPLARDVLYGALSEVEAKQKVADLSLSKSDNFVSIIFENASYYARR